MGKMTGIDWTDSTWGVLRGCSPVSDGCKHCYAANMAHRFGNPGHPFVGLTKTNGQFNGNVQFVEKHLLDPLKWGPVLNHMCDWHIDQVSIFHKQSPRQCKDCSWRPRRIFVNSMSDLFHENVTDEMRDQIFAVMALCPQHIFQVLTKRPERMLRYFSQREAPADMKGKVFSWSSRQGIGLMGLGICMKLAEKGKLKNVGRIAISGEPGIEGELKTWPLPNVWLGLSVENQATADERIPLLLQTPAAVRFVSCEPLLGELCIERIPRREHYYEGSDPLYWKPLDDGLDWVIAGGESGPGARPMHPDWARGLRDQCQAASVPFFFKSWGEWSPTDFRVANGGSVSGDGAMARFGKKVAGSLLDGVEYKQFPEVK